MSEVYIILWNANLKIGDEYVLTPKDFNLSLGKRIHYFFNVEKLSIEVLKENVIMRLSLDNNYKIIDIYKYSMEEIKKYIVLL